MGRSSMKPITAEWLAKADGDLTTARRELRSCIGPNYDNACFHALAAALPHDGEPLSSPQRQINRWLSRVSFEFP